jgi:hypothetical protein
LKGRKLMKRILHISTVIILTIALVVNLSACANDDSVPETTATPTLTVEATPEPMLDVNEQYEEDAVEPELTPEPNVDIFSFGDFDTQADVILYILVNHALIHEPWPDYFGNLEWLDWAIPELVEDFMGHEFTASYIRLLELIVKDQLQGLTDEEITMVNEMRSSYHNYGIPHFHEVDRIILERLREAEPGYYTDEEIDEYVFLTKVVLLLWRLPMFINQYGGEHAMDLFPPPPPF